MGTLRLSCALVYQILGSRARGRKMFLSPVCYRGRRGERLVEAQSFHLPSLWPARFWKRLAECFANALPWVRARGAHCKTALREADGEAMALPFVVGPWVGSGSRERSPSRGEEAAREDARPPAKGYANSVPVKTKGAAVMPRPSCVPLACAFGSVHGPLSSAPEQSSSAQPS